jgi:hypothetical protein
LWARTKRERSALFKVHVWAAALADSEPPCVVARARLGEPKNTGSTNEACILPRGKHVQTRTYRSEVADAVLEGALPGRLVALLDGWEGYRKPHMWTADDWRRWQTLAPSQRALAASAQVDSHHGGDRTHWCTTATDAAHEYECSRRLVLAAMALRKHARRRPALLRAVATGTVGLMDALRHVDQPANDLRSAIAQVRQRKARSIEQALRSSVSVAPVLAPAKEV